MNKVTRLNKLFLGYLDLDMFFLHNKNRFIWGELTDVSARIYSPGIGSTKSIGVDKNPAYKGPAYRGAPVSWFR